ncbi:NB-ARC domain-containing protein [Tolypothrix tenuis]
MHYVSHFFGRTQELNTLQQWIVQDKCRLIALLGMGGMGKTSLAVKLQEQIHGDFKYVIRRSLKNAPPLSELLGSLLKLLSKDENIDIPDNINIRIARLINYLSSHRYLLLLDDGEEILQPRELMGQYRQGFEDYEKLFRQVGERPHQSCLLLISREKPKIIESLEDNTQRVRSYQIQGLDDEAAKEIFKIKSFSGSESRLNELINLYQSNPFKLNIVARTIQELFGGSVTNFLDQATLDFNDISNLIDTQFQRLSDLEKEIMYGLASAGQPLLLTDLRQQINKKGITDAMKSLTGRGLIEKTEGEKHFTLQRIVMKYVNRKLSR